MLCSKPIEVQAAGGVVPCGRCFHCRTNKKLKRKSRMLLEDRMSVDGKSCFITLTYDDDHLPLTAVNPETGEVYESETGTLDPWETQAFIKRLRRNFKTRYGRFFRFAYCGEYGSGTFRPHYHFLIFGADKKELGPQSRTDLGPVYESWTNPATKKLKCDPSRIDIQNPLNSGHVASYISDYLMKGIFEERQKKAGQKYPEFFRSSQGLGRPAVEGLARAMQTDSSWQYIWDHGAIPHTFEIDGKNYLLDSYMRNKILEQFGPAIAEEIKKKALERYRDEMQKLCEEAGFNIETYFEDRPKDQRPLAKLFVSKNAQEMMLREAKYARFNPTKRGL